MARPIWERWRVYAFADSILVGDWQSLKEEDQAEDNLPEDTDETE